MLKLRRADPQAEGTIDEDRCWQAVQTRDAGFDGQFVYADRSTGIYCRPSCPVGRPKRGHVAFYRAAETAEQAGFRPCGYCNPRTYVPIGSQVMLVRDVCRYIEDHLDHSLTLSSIGHRFNLSPYHLQRVFKRVMGITPRQYADACRLARVKARLRGGDSVTDALYDAGYSSSSRLYERAGSQLGMTPATYRRGGEGMFIRFTICDYAFGRVLIGITERGVCAIHLGNEDAELLARLVNEYPAATLQRVDLVTDAWVNRILDFLDGWTPHLDLPLDVRATAFQWRVWQELQTIPFGETRTYRDIAAAIGKPSAASAVARAIAENPVDALIPGHRVERADGHTTSFYDPRGVDAHRKLAALEKGSSDEKAD